MWQRVVISCLLVMLGGCSFFFQQSADSKPETEVAVCPPPPVCPICPAAIVCPKPSPQPVPKPPLRAVDTEDLPIIGSVEYVHWLKPDIQFEARIDTGAESSSLDARDIVRFERDGKRWVRFTVFDGEEQVTLERRVKRRVLIKQQEGLMDRRYVVRLRLQMGAINELVDVTLTDRSQMDYPLLIGRNFLTDTAIVDVSRRHTIKPPKKVAK